MGYEISWKELKGKRCLVCVFPPHLDETTARSMSQRVLDEVGGDSDGALVVWDASGMEAYDRGAREVWQAAVKALAPRRPRIHLVTRSSAVRLGAAAISLFTSFDIATWQSVDAMRLD